MAKRPTAAQAWLDDFKPAARGRGMRFVSGTAFVVDDVYITSLAAWIAAMDRATGSASLSWAVRIKPLAVDEVLWAAFLPDLEMGPQKRINHRISGAFQVRPLPIARGSIEIASDDAPAWDPVLDEFDRVRSEFVVAHVDVAGFVAALEQAGRRDLDAELVRWLTALIAAGRNDEARRDADEAIARGKSGGMLSTVDVLTYLTAYAKGPEAYAAFTASLAPTHTVEVLRTSGGSTRTELSREHHPGAIRHRLADLDGADPWAVVLIELPPPGIAEKDAESSYIQVAGTAEAMVVEICVPDGDGASTRSVVGRPGARDDSPVVEIVLPSSTERIAPQEVFGAEEAAELFDSFYKAGVLPAGYLLRPVERYS